MNRTGQQPYIYDLMNPFSPGRFLCLTLISIALTAFSGCSNELEVNADWKETAVVYGLLNPSDSLQYVRIQKTYQNKDADAAAIAQIADSIYYDSLIVELVEINSGNRVSGYKTKIADKNTGYFTAENYAYVFKTRPNSQNQYRLEISNPVSGYKANSQTAIVGSMQFQNPNTFPNYLLDLDPARFFNVSFRTATAGKSYDLIGRFYYQEYPAGDTSQKTTYSIDYNFFRNYVTTSTVGNMEAIVSVKGDEFYNFLVDKLPENQNIKRRMLYMDFIFYVGTEDLYDYINIGGPTLGIVQKSASYSNINNGIGIFSSRNVSIIPKVKFSPRTKQTLSATAPYSKLRFDGK